MDFPEGEFTVFLNKGCVVDFTKESPPIHFLCNGDETQKSWKPLLNMISALRGSSEWLAQLESERFLLWLALTQPLSFAKQK